MQLSFAKIRNIANYDMKNDEEGNKTCFFFIYVFVDVLTNKFCRSAKEPREIKSPRSENER